MPKKTKGGSSSSKRKTYRTPKRIGKVTSVTIINKRKPYAKENILAFEEAIKERVDKSSDVEYIKGLEDTIERIKTFADAARDVPNVFIPLIRVCISEGQVLYETDIRAKTLQSKEYYDGLVDGLRLYLEIIGIK